MTTKKPSLAKRVEALERENAELRQMVEEHREAQKYIAREIAALKRSQNNVSAQEMMTIMGQVKRQ